MKLKKAIMLLAVAVMAICTLAAAPAPRMIVEQPTYDAGTLYRTGQNIEHAFIVKNAGNTELKILSAQPG